MGVDSALDPALECSRQPCIGPHGDRVDEIGHRHVSKGVSRLQRASVIQLTGAREISGKRL
jgi:hypothetical protein